MKKMNKKGFTLAELLIVVAIIAVLVAIAIPVFSAQLEKAKERTDMANLRSAWGEATASYLADGTCPATVTIGGITFNVTSDSSGVLKSVKAADASKMQSTKYGSFEYSGTGFSE